MTGPSAVPPRCRLPQPGEELHLQAGECRYHGGAFVLRVERPRPDLSSYYDGLWLWLEGWRLDENGLPQGQAQFLVSTGAINRNHAERSH